MQPDFILLRHGIDDISVDERPLSDKGIQGIEMLCDEMLLNGEYSRFSLFCSPSLRCIETATILGDHLHINEVNVDPIFSEDFQAESACAFIRSKQYKNFIIVTHQNLINSICKVLFTGTDFEGSTFCINRGSGVGIRYQEQRIVDVRQITANSTKTSILK